MITKFNYIKTPLANFLLTPQEATIIGTSALGGGLLQGAGVISSNAALGEDVRKQDIKKELAANTTAGVASGVGGYLITKAMNQKLGII